MTTGEAGTEHPDRRLAKGSFELMTIDEQVLQQSLWRHLLDHGGKSNVVSEESLRLLARAHEELDVLYRQEGVAYETIVERHPDAPPLLMLCLCAFYGVYPPPELLLTILDVWNSYASNDDVSLEEAFFGKPIKKLGAYKKRVRARTRRAMRYDYFKKLTAAGMSPIEAAERVAELGLGGSTDADSVLREMRACAKAERDTENKSPILSSR